MNRTSVLIKTTTTGEYWYKNTWNKLVEKILQFELWKKTCKEKEKLSWISFPMLT
jgi:hypothetical protein